MTTKSVKGAKKAAKTKVGAGKGKAGEQQTTFPQEKGRMAPPDGYHGEERDPCTPEEAVMMAETGPTRLVRRLWWSECGHYFVIRITKDGVSTDYFVRRDCYDDNRFVVTNLAPDGQSNGYITHILRPFCSCAAGMCRDTCKHIEALQALQAAKRL